MRQEFDKVVWFILVMHLLKIYWLRLRSDSDQTHSPSKRANNDWVVIRRTEYSMPFYSYFCLVSDLRSINWLLNFIHSLQEFNSRKVQYFHCFYRFSLLFNGWHTLWLILSLFVLVYCGLTCDANANVATNALPTLISVKNSRSLPNDTTTQRPTDTSLWDTDRFRINYIVLLAFYDRFHVNTCSAQ